MSSKILTLYRGDSFNVALSIEDDSSKDGVYWLNENDFVYFAIAKAHQPFEDAIIKIKYSVEDQDKCGRFIVHIPGETTADLEPGTYYYTAKLRQNAGDEYEDVTTFIKRTKLIILES